MLKERNHKEMAREEKTKGEMEDTGMRGNSQSYGSKAGIKNGRFGDLEPT